MALYCVCVVPKQYTIPLLPCSVYDLLVVFCVSCTVKALYKCPSPLLSSGTNALLDMFFCLMTKKKQKKKSQRRVRREVRGGGLRRLEVRGGTVKQKPLHYC